MNETKQNADSATGCLDNNKLAAGIVSAYVANNSVPAGDLPDLVMKVRSALGGEISAAIREAAAQKATPAEIKKSITPDYLVSFLDGKSYRTLKRHLGTHGHTPETYRAKFGLSADYPMVAPNYSEKRAALARSFGLGQQRRKAGV